MRSISGGVFLTPISSVNGLIAFTEESSVNGGSGRYEPATLWGLCKRDYEGLQRFTEDSSVNGTIPMSSFTEDSSVNRKRPDFLCKSKNTQKGTPNWSKISEKSTGKRTCNLITTTFTNWYQN